MLVLIAEDDAVSQLILRTAVEQLGHDCLVAADGNQAWALFQAAEVDVVISDRMMPGMDGLELCLQVRASPKAGYTYFIFLTSLADKAQLREGIERGADDYLAKPLDLDELQLRLLVAERITELHRQLGTQRAELERMNQALFDQSRTDQLTQLGNRLRLSEDLVACLGLVNRYGHVYSAVLCDVDYFKAYNDHYGHPAGDEVLRQVAQIIRQCCRESDYSYRYGGEEFLIILPQQSVENARCAAERLRKAVAARAIPHTGSHAIGIVSISAGVASIGPGEGKSAELWLKQADVALYRAKGQGRNRVELYQP